MLKSQSRNKKAPKLVLALPDLEQTRAAVLNSLTSGAEQPDIRQRPADLRPCHSRVRRE
jgi:hypothetical protein